MAQKKERPVVVTTEFRGVFFGYLEKEAGDTVILARGRNCVYWTADVHGFAGLAVNGPVHGCRIGPAVDRIKLRKVTSLIDCTEKAVKAWEMAPW